MVDSKNVDFTRRWVTAQPVVTSFLFASVRNPHDAEDLLQEVAAAALGDYATFDADRPFVPWVLGIARFRVLNYYRRHASDKLQFDDATLAVFAAAHESVASQASDRRSALQECLKRLDGRKRTVLQMRYAEDCPVQQIAQSLSTTANAISLLLHKVRKVLASCIEHQLSG